MLDFKIGNKVVPIKSCYGDLTVKELYELREMNEPVSIFMKLTGLNELEVVAVDHSKLMLSIGFINTPIYEAVEATNQITYQDRVYELPRVEACSWFQKLRGVDMIDDPVRLVALYLSTIIRKKGSLEQRVDKAPEIIERLENMDVESVYGVGKWLSTQIIEIVDRENKKLTTPPDKIKEAAGISMYNELGNFNNIDMVAGGDPLKYDAVLELPYEVVYIKLRKSTIDSIFNKNYAEELKKQSKTT